MATERHEIGGSEHYAWISGGAGGLGVAFAKALLAEGASGVALADLRESPAVSKLKQQFPGRLLFSLCDITDHSAVKRSLLESQRAFGGKLTILVNNAGTAEREDVDMHFKVNLFAPMFVTNFGIGLLSKQPADSAGFRGCIINVASAAGVLPQEEATMYTASKSGLVGFTRCFRKCRAKTGVAVNALAPGFTETPFIHSPNMPSDVKQNIASLGVMRAEQVGDAFLKLLRLSRSKSGEVRWHSLPVFLCGFHARFEHG